jgi:hypothetical protein
VAKRLKKLTPIVDAEKPIYYCRKCGYIKTEKDFYKSFDDWLDGNGKLSICSQCISEMYVSVYAIEHSLERTIFILCRALNIKYDESAVQSTLSHLTTSGKQVDDPTTFGLYKVHVLPRTEMGRGSMGVSSTSAGTLTFQEDVPIPSHESAKSGDFDSFENVSKFWGDGFSTEDYQYLEMEFANFKNTHRADSYAEVVLLKEVCYKLLEIQKTRLAGKSTASGVKELQTLMSSLAISPDKANQASAGKSLECFGQWVKEIEEFRPAEYFEDKSIYKDVDNIEEYGRKYITEPLRSFVMGSNEFGTDELEKMLDEEAMEE